MLAFQLTTVRMSFCGPTLMVLQTDTSAHAGTYSMDFAWHTIHIKEDAAKELSNYVIARIREYEREHSYKFLGGGTSIETWEICPYLPTRMWAELDIVTMVFKHEIESHSIMNDYQIGVDEEADSMARKCVMWVDLLDGILSGENEADDVSGTMAPKHSRCSSLAFATKLMLTLLERHFWQRASSTRPP